MKLNYEHQEFGEFWLVTDPEVQYSGLLEISASGKVKLRLHCVSKNETFLNYCGASQFLPTINGALSNFGMVTLLDNIIIGNIPLNNNVEVQIHSSLLIHGSFFQNKEDIRINEAFFSFERFTDWVGIYGFSKPEYNNTKAVMTQKYLDPITMLDILPESYTIEFNSSSKLSPLQSHQSMTQEAYIKLKSTHKLTLNDLLNRLYKINTFLCLTIQEPISPLYLKFVSEEKVSSQSQPGQRQSTAQVIFKSTFLKTKDEEISPYNFLFRFIQIRKTSQQIFKAWFERFDSIKPAIDLYFSTYIGLESFHETRFLTFAQALENFHRRTKKTTNMEKHKFENLCSKILDSCPEDHKTWLKARLTHGNELSLRKRFKALFEPFVNLFRSKNEVNKLISRIVDTRNYLTHYSEELESKAVKFPELHHLNSVLDLLFVLNILQLLEVDEEIMIQTKKSLKNKHSLHHLQINSSTEK